MRVTAVVLLVSVAAANAVAGPYERLGPVADPVTRKECGECHMAYQPGLLPAESWRRIMTNLNDHFGDSAILPPDIAAKITDYLTAHAGRGDGSVTRITEQSWWLRKHSDRKLQRRAKTKIVKSDCAACHDGAERGLYDDD